MPKYVAFLRAINVGGHIVKMDQLRKLFEILGFSNVETFIASGNVIFDSASKSPVALEKKIEAHLKKELGYEVATFIRSVPELVEIANHKPFKDGDDHTVYIVLTSAAPTSEAEKQVLSYSNAVDDFHVKGSSIFWLCRKGFSESTISGGLLEKALQMPATVRNSNTIRRIASKYS